MVMRERVPRKKDEFDTAKSSRYIYIYVLTFWQKEESCGEREERKEEKREWEESSAI